MCNAYLLFWLQSQPKTAAGCLYLCKTLPSIVRIMLKQLQTTVDNYNYIVSNLSINHRKYSQTALDIEHTVHRNSPESISATGGNALRVLVAPWDAENAIFPMLYKKNWFTCRHEWKCIYRYRKLQFIRSRTHHNVLHCGVPRIIIVMQPHFCSRFICKYICPYLIESRYHFSFLHIPDKTPIPGCCTGYAVQVPYTRWMWPLQLGQNSIT